MVLVAISMIIFLLGIIFLVIGYIKKDSGWKTFGWYTIICSIMLIIMNLWYARII